MMPRDRDPAVWAATFGAAFDREFAAEYSACTDDPPWRTTYAIERIDIAACTAIADAAVRVLHLEPWEEPIGDRLARATVHPEALRPPLPLPEPTTPSDLLAALQAAERAYLLAAGWTPTGQPGWWQHPAYRKTAETHDAIRLAKIDAARAGSGGTS